MKFLIPVMCALLLCHYTSFAQKKFGYTYDDAGNMIRRYEIVIGASAAKLAKEDTTNPVVEEKFKYIYKVFPNPVQEALRVYVEKLDTTQTYNWHVTDLMGKMVIYGNAQVNLEQRIEFGSLAAGQYILSLMVGEGDKKRKDFKIIKE